jgi:hypothetical protein
VYPPFAVILVHINAAVGNLCRVGRDDDRNQLGKGYSIEAVEEHVNSAGR